MTPCLAAAYGDAPAVPSSPAVDDVFTIVPPPCSIMWRSSACMHRNTPFRLTAITRSHASSSPSDDAQPGHVDPRVVERAVERAVAVDGRGVDHRGHVGRARDVGRDEAARRLPASHHGRTVSSPPSPSRSATTTPRAPSFANTSAAPRPIPDAAAGDQRDLALDHSSHRAHRATAPPSTSMPSPVTNDDRSLLEPDDGLGDLLRLAQPAARLHLGHALDDPGIDVEPAGDRAACAPRPGTPR